MKARTQRFWFISVSVLFFATAAAIMLFALKDNVTFFYSPSEVLTKTIDPLQRIRIGGMVLEGSLKQDGVNSIFKVTDFQSDMEIHYQGLLPDLFREGQGVVAQGYLVSPDLFRAEVILAKHDENYMPPELANLTQSGEKN